MDGGESTRLSKNQTVKQRMPWTSVDFGSFRGLFTVGTCWGTTHSSRKEMPGLVSMFCLASLVAVGACEIFINQILSIGSDPPIVSCNRTIGSKASQLSVELGTQK